jgi:hypothetical protein
MNQVGLSEPYLIGQAREVTLRTYGRQLPMQCDGEPWSQSPATITLKAAEEYTQVGCLRDRVIERDLQATLLAHPSITNELKAERKKSTKFY